jgi:outer membrane biosynthesis protein TonB
MPIPEPEMLGPALERRLKAALDRVTPPSPLLASARYKAAAARLPRKAWRLAPALVGIGAAGIALTAAAATGSPNPVVWTERAGSVIQSVGHIPATSPKATHKPEPSDEARPGQVGGPGRPTPTAHGDGESPEPTEKPEASPKPEPSERPEPAQTPEPANHTESSPTPDHRDD